MITVDDIKTRVEGHALVRGVDLVRKGAVRLETAFLYPDGSSVDVFVQEETPLFNKPKLSDFGQTTAWLLDVQVKPWLSKKRQQFVEDALRIYGVQHRFKPASARSSRSSSRTRICFSSRIRSSSGVAVPPSGWIFSSREAPISQRSLPSHRGTRRRRTSLRTRSSVAGTTSTSPSGRNRRSPCSTTGSTCIATGI